MFGPEHESVLNLLLSKGALSTGEIADHIGIVRGTRSKEFQPYNRLMCALRRLRRNKVIDRTGKFWRVADGVSILRVAS